MSSNTTTLLAVDNSGSTGGCRAYWRYVGAVHAALVAEAGGDAGAVRILLWNSTAEPVTVDKFTRTIVPRGEGVGGTEPACLARPCRGFTGRLVLVTDGQVSEDCVDRVDAKLGGRAFEHVTVHLVNTGGVVSRSVSCAFTRSSPHRVLHVDGRAAEHVPVPALVADVSAADLAALEALDALADPAAFVAAYPALERAFVARTMGTAGDAPLRARVLALSKRLTAHIATHAAAGLGEALYADLTRGDVASAEARVRDIVAAHADAGGGGIHKQIAFLLRSTEGALRRAFSTDEIASQRAVAAPVTAAPAVATVDAEEAAATAAAAAEAAAPVTPFRCPITLDDVAAHNVVLLLRDGPPLLAGVDKALVDALLDCPLALTKRADMEPVRAALLARLDHAISLEAARGVLEPTSGAGSRGGPVRSPMTRQPVLRGGLCLGAAPEHAAATDATLFAFLTGGKRLGNPDLWFAALTYVLTQQEDAAPWLAPTHPALLAHLRWRLAHRTSFASLSGLATTVTTRMPLGAAAWFCWGGAGAHNDVAPRTEALRAHMGHAAALVWLVRDVGGYPVSPAARAHTTRLQVLLAFLRTCKLGHASWAALRMELRGLVQRTALVMEPTGEPGSFKPLAHATLRNNERGGDLARLRRVPLDGPADPAVADAIFASFPPAWRAVDRATLLGLAALVDPSQAAGDVGVPTDWAPPPGILTPPEPLWALSKVPHPGPPPSLTIVPATMRPRYAPAPRETWRDAAARHFPGVEPAALLSTAKQYMECMCRIGEVPTRESLLLHAYARVVGRYGPAVAALPAHMEAYIEEDLALFAAAMAGVSAAEAIRRYRASVRIEDRVRMEA